MGTHLTIKPLATYTQYRWSDFSSGGSLTVDQPGAYWLQVTDSNNCVGTDTILINQTHCLNEPLVPSAFTPNGDGLNDQFKPLLSGNVNRFIFTIYNRWGNKVFETQSVQRGWDGKLNGVPAVGGVYIWYCEYQVAGQSPQKKKGTVMLIR
jgi:gliding motility-associated-like protein